MERDYKLNGVIREFTPLYNAEQLGQRDFRFTLRLYQRAVKRRGGSEETAPRS